ncbi:VanW family protein [Metabacillus sp. KIGAM252]|uniref:VanW family protein n=1 Tax=Metabacillus flavus TaxID=2823519 RepID=A0ABS5LGR8_9BACI|nr:VanW family protein [Metabacillus flavus]
MRNSGLKVFLALLICTAYLTGFSYTGEAVWDYLSNGDRFEPNTKIASIDISGLPQKKAAQKVEDSIKQWKNENPVKLTFLQQEQILPENAIQFNVDESIRSAVNGQTNPLEVSLDSMLVDRILADLASNDASQIDMDTVKKQIVESAVNLGQGENYNLEKYVAGEERVIHEASLSVPADDPEILKFVQSNPTVKIEAQSQWSLFKQFPEATDQSSLGMLASAVFQSVLGTNFIVVERHTGIAVPSYTSPGLEAKIIPNEMDLKVFNPNHTDYSLTFELNEGNLTVKVTGKPLLYAYEPVISEPEYFPFKQIIRYNPALSVGEEKKTRSGADGLLINVSRRVLDSQGFSMGIEKIAEDFYPPIHEILEKRYYVPIETVEPVINDLLNPETGLPAAPADPEPAPAAEEEPASEPPVQEEPETKTQQPAESESESGQSDPKEEPAAAENQEPIEK